MADSPGFSPNIVALSALCTLFIVVLFYLPLKHYTPRLRIIIITILGAISIPLAIWHRSSNGQQMTFAEFVSLDGLYSLLVFTLLTHWLKRGLARELTECRGENWTKELDYIYLFLASLGVALSIGKSSFVTGRFDLEDIVGPLVVSTAIVIRTIRTRAEIAGWNKK